MAERKFQFKSTGLEMHDIIELVSEILYYVRAMRKNNPTRWKSIEQNVHLVMSEIVFELKKKHVNMHIMIDMCADFPISYFMQPYEDVEVTNYSIAVLRMKAITLPLHEAEYKKDQHMKWSLSIIDAIKLLTQNGCAVKVGPSSEVLKIVSTDDNNFVIMENHHESSYQQHSICTKSD